MNGLKYQKIKIKEKYLLVYDLVKTPLLVKLVNKISKENDLKVISFSSNKGYKNWLKSFSYSSPSELLGLFMGAQKVVTSSFHGTAFSLIFEKDFYTIPHPTRGKRMIDLLNNLSLEDRLIEKEVDIYNIRSIDYATTNKKLEKMINKSIKYLEDSLR